MTFKLKYLPLALIAMLMTTGCVVRADGPPEIVVDRTACSHCGMLISEPIYAAAYRPAGGEARVFDDIGCLLDSLGGRTGADVRLWFHDGSDGAWIDGAQATFVAAREIRTPMGGGVIAFRDGAAATGAAAAHRGEVVRSVAGLMAARGTR